MYGGKVLVAREAIAEGQRDSEVLDNFEPLEGTIALSCYLLLMHRVQNVHPRHHSGLCGQLGCALSELWVYT
jgi:hypothetical protein